MIKTSVVFCGGYGTRLGSITQKIPKPMVLVNKKPFLEHLIVQLKNLGIKKIFLLVGYKHNQIKKYFKNGKKFGLEIIYSFNEPDKETGYRLNSIRDKIKEDFLLMYADNYSPFNLITNYHLQMILSKIIKYNSIKNIRKQKEIKDLLLQKMV